MNSSDVDLTRTPTFNDVQSAYEVVRDRIIHTPLLPASRLDVSDGISLWLKAETLQNIGVFKVRGALNAVGRLTPEQLGKGVVTVSAGNHGIALSYAASALGSQATVVMPDTAAQTKIDIIRRFGGRPVLVDGTKLLDNMEQIRTREGSTFIHPFDHPDVIAGQGTVGLEILDDMPDVDAVIVPVGGGGLISGIALAVKARRPQTIVIGVEPEGSAVVSKSLKAGSPVALDAFATVADGLNAPWAGPISFGIIQALVDEVITVPDGEIVSAMVTILERSKILVEPAGAAAVAGILSGHLPSLAGKKVVAILSGGNVDLSKLRSYLSDK